jgi:chaperone modulatory protein CbpM
MITLETIFVEFTRLHPDDLNRWIAESYIRPEGEPGAYRFRDIDIARLRLIIDLRDTCEIPEPAFPTVLSLIDQLYDLRRQMLHLNAALDELLPAEIRATLQARLQIK